MYSPSLPRYPRGAAVPSPSSMPSAPSGPHRPSPAASTRTFAAAAAAAAADEDDDLLSADELVKTLQPPPSAGDRARPVPGPANASGTQGPAAAAGDPRSRSSRSAILTPHDFFQPPPRLPRDVPAWPPHVAIHADDRRLGPKNQPVPAGHGHPVAHPAGYAVGHPMGHLAGPMVNELPPDMVRVRAYQVMAAHQRQAQLHTQLQLRQYQHQQHQQHEPFLAPQHPHHRVYLDDGPLAHPAAQHPAHTQLRRRNNGNGGRHGYEHAHRIHRELQPPPAGPTRVYAGRPTRRRVASPASPDFDPQFDLLPFDPAGMDLYDADDLHLPLSLAGPQALDAADDVLGRPTTSGRRLGRAGVAHARSTTAAMDQPRGRLEQDAESGRTRPPPSEVAQGAAKRAKTAAKSAVKPAAKRGVKASKAAAKPKEAESKFEKGGEEEEKEKEKPAETKRRCGRKSMNYSSEQKRERNRAAVKKCRQRQALKLEYLAHKGEVLQGENQALSDMLVKNVELDETRRRSLTRGIQMDILLKIKEIFTQSLPKDFVLDADSIWDLNSVLAVSMPSRCYYGIESIKDFWRTSLRMRNKGKIRSFWAWLFRLPPGDRFSEFVIEPFSPSSSLYFISWTTKSDPPLAGSMVIMFGHGHRVTLHVECFGWLIWRYLLTNEPFPEPPME